MACQTCPRELIFKPPQCGLNLPQNKHFWSVEPFPALSKVFHSLTRTFLLFRSFLRCTPEPQLPDLVFTGLPGCHSYNTSPLEPTQASGNNYWAADSSARPYHPDLSRGVYVRFWLCRKNGQLGQRNGSGGKEVCCQG